VLVAKLDLSQRVLSGYMSAETASHHLTLAYCHSTTAYPQEWFTPSSASPRLPVATRHTASLPDGHPVQLVPPRDIDALAAGLLSC